MAKPWPPPRGCYVGNGITVLRFNDGTIRVQHRCHRRITAIKLSGRHRITQDSPLTITPLISCPDCTLRGRVTDGAWKDVR